MARPMKFDRDEAVEIVMNEIWRDGYEAASVKALSEKLSITRSSFYNTFGSREALFREAMRRYAGLGPDCELYAMTKDASLKTVLTRMFREVCRRRAADPEHRGCLATNSVAELLAREDELGAFMSELLRAVVARIEEKVGWAVEKGELPASTDVHAMALAIQSLMLGVNLQSKHVHDEADLWASASTSLKALGLWDPEAVEPTAEDRAAARAEDP
ncbi:MAG: TetR/AcrR family transcriptional regulator [Rhodobacter sp.]|nr:TetR/AcrR family transcriptional regulator [Rhodobacter sp.]